jgi:disulfide bond formation protein DsbB
MKYLSYSLVNLYGFFIALVILITSVYLQVEVGVLPCPLCMLQRLLVVVIGILFLAGVFIPLKRFYRQCYQGGILFFTLLGIITAARHIYLQQLHSTQVPQCAPGLKFLLTHLPLHEALQVIFSNTASCAHVDWSWLGVSLPEWSLFFFVVFLIVSVAQMLRS